MGRNKAETPIIIETLSRDLGEGSVLTSLDVLSCTRMKDLNFDLDMHNRLGS